MIIQVIYAGIGSTAVGFFFLCSSLKSGNALFEGMQQEIDELKNFKERIEKTQKPPQLERMELPEKEKLEDLFTSQATRDLFVVSRKEIEDISTLHYPEEQTQFQQTDKYSDEEQLEKNSQIKNKSNKKKLTKQKAKLFSNQKKEMIIEDDFYQEKQQEKRKNDAIKEINELDLDGDYDEYKEDFSFSHFIQTKDESTATAVESAEVSDDFINLMMSLSESTTSEMEVLEEDLSELPSIMDIPKEIPTETFKEEEQLKNQVEIPLYSAELPTAKPTQPTSEASAIEELLKKHRPTE